MRKTAKNRVKNLTTTPRVTSVYYQTSKQVAPYQHKHFGVEVAVGDGVSAKTALQHAVALVHQQLGIPSAAPRPVTVLGVEKMPGRGPAVYGDLGIDSAMGDQDEEIPF